ncbi:TPA: fun domain protein [Neisseria polysaccharea]
MKFINELSFGFPDAENYKRKENKGLFNKIFIKDDYLQKILNPSTSFLIGEKGTGKTAYAVFLSNNHSKIIFPA